MLFERTNSKKLCVFSYSISSVLFLSKRFCNKIHRNLLKNYILKLFFYSVYIIIDYLYELNVSRGGILIFLDDNGWANDGVFIYVIYHGSIFLASKFKTTRCNCKIFYIFLCYSNILPKKIKIFLF